MHPYACATCEYQVKKKETRVSRRLNGFKWKKNLEFSEKPTCQRKEKWSGILALCVLLPENFESKKGSKGGTRRRWNEKQE